MGALGPGPAGPFDKTALGGGGVKAKFRGSQKALAIKKRVVSLHAEPLEEELGVAIITRAL